jgi:hypothetical protein
MCSFLLALPKLRVLSIKRCLWLKTDLYEKIVRDASCTLVECDFTGSGGIGRNRGSWTCKFNRSMVPYHPLLDPQASITMALVMDSAPPGAQPFAFFINQTPRGYTATKPLSPELSRKKLEYARLVRVSAHGKEIKQVPSLPFDEARHCRFSLGPFAPKRPTGISNKFCCTSPLG